MRNSVPVVKDLFCHFIEIPKTRKSTPGIKEIRETMFLPPFVGLGIIHEFGNTTAVS